MRFPFPLGSVTACSYLRADGVSFSFGTHRVLTDVSFIASAHERVGVIGENGSGKSTLLRILAGSLEPTAGAVVFDVGHGRRPTIGFLRQNPSFSGRMSVSDSIETVAAPARCAANAVTKLGEEIARKPESRTISDAYAHALETAENLGSWDIDARISSALMGLGLDSINPDRPTASLSGGQRSRLALALLLSSGPDILLLDEPTNNLDDAAVSFLVDVLASWRGLVVMASHDRAFLDGTATSLLDLDPTPVPHAVAASLARDDAGAGIGATRFTGTYSDYLATQADAEARWERRYRDEQAEIVRLRSTVGEQQAVGHPNWHPRSEVRESRKFYADRNARVVSRRVNDARHRLSEMEKRQIRRPPAKLRFRGLTAAGRPTGPSAARSAFTAMHVGVQGRLAPVSFDVRRGEKWLVTGPNGSGKSTLLDILAGNLKPDAGSLIRSPRDRVGLLAQETDIPDTHQRGPGRTTLEAYEDIVGAELAAQVPLGVFGLISAHDFNRPVSQLSGGSQKRLALSILLADPPEILLLDEPTNHFSLRLVDELEEALKEYPGTIVVASHDRWLREHWEARQLALGGPDDAPNHTNPQGGRIV